MSTKDASEEQARRSRFGERLRVELDDERVELVDPVATRVESLDGLSPSEVTELEDVLIEELAYARTPPVHEGRTPSYGCFVFPGTDLPRDLPEGVSCIDLTNDADHLGARELADGVSTFLARTSQNGAALLHVEQSDEQFLANVAADGGSWIVQRHPNGTVRVFGRERLYLFDKDAWVVKPYGYTRWVQLTHAVGAEFGQADVGMSLLNLCLHVLSARRIGATFVWMVRGGVDTLESHLQRSSRPLAAPLNVTRPEDFRTIATLLATLDGACIVDEDGRIVGVEAFLQVDRDAVEVVAPHGGTRHTSAARFSYSVPEAVVFVVSADGPVTVFSDGVDALRLDEESPYSSMLNSEAKFSKIGRVENAPATCERCSKRVAIEITMVEGSNRVRAAICPVCGVSLGEFECFSLKYRVLKAWEPEDASVTWGFRAAATVSDHVRNPMPGTQKAADSPLEDV